jgi:uncharacterized protein (DUF1015 family)|tara:strand:- start:2555 stop:3829 length:1275 start_codon:yes stop_codon:yes gene_type:complete
VPNNKNPKINNENLVQPLIALCPLPEIAGSVAAPPYDVLSSDEARIAAEGNPHSFLHISKPEIDLEETISPFDQSVYLKAHENFRKMLQTGSLIRDATPCYYIYRMNMKGHSQTGLVAVSPVSAYNENRIKRHELTRPDKEDDRVKQIDSINAQTGPVLVVHKPREAINCLLNEITQGSPLYNVKFDNGVVHTLWRVGDLSLIEKIDFAYGSLKEMYIADGHHRSAAASRVTKMRQHENPSHEGNEPYNYFLTVSFSSDELQILDYNRVVRDLNNLTTEEFLSELSKDFIMTKENDPVQPDHSNVFGMYISGDWYRLVTRAQTEITASAVDNLDVQLLTELILKPLLSIGDLRTDPRIDFVGGVRGLGELESRVNSGNWSVAFSLYPTSINELMVVADAGEVMPPKSTWFEPKLADGLVSYPLD